MTKDTFFKAKANFNLLLISCNRKWQEKYQIDLMRKDKRLYIIFSITLVAVMGVASLTPALPKIAETLHITKVQVGLLISAFTFPGIFLAPIAGILADRWGRKKVLIPSLFIFAIAGSTAFFIHSFHVLVLLRIFQGVGASALGSLNVTLIGDFFKGKDRPKVMGYNASVLSLATGFFPLIGGMLAGIAWYYPFLLPIFAIPVGLIVIFFLEEPEFEKTPNLKVYLKAISKSIQRKEVIATFALSVLTFLILYGAILTYIPFLLSQNFKLSAPKIGIALSLSSLSTAAVASQVGKLTNRFGSITLLKSAFILYTITMLMVPYIHSFYFFIIPLLLFGSAQALNIPSLQTLLANLAPDEQRGLFMSINGMVLRLGQTLGPLVIGLGFAIGGFEGAYFLAASIAVACLIVIYTSFHTNISN